MKKYQNILSFIFVSLIVAGLLFLMHETYVNIKQKKHIVAKTKEEVLLEIKEEKIASEYQDFENAIKEKQIVITKNYKEIVKNNHTLGSGIKKQYNIIGKFEFIYLYLDGVTVGNKRALFAYENPYLKISQIEPKAKQKEEFGGKLNKDSFLKLPNDKKNAFFYNIDNIKYTEDETYTIKNTDFLSLLQNSTKIQIYIAINTDVKSRFIDEVILYYKCAESSDCSIEAI